MLDKKLEGSSGLGPLWPRQLWGCLVIRKEKRGFQGQAKHTNPKVQPGQAMGIGSSSEKGAGAGGTRRQK